MSEDDLLQQGIAAARAGRRDEARTLLMQVVEADERNEQAWLWLAGVIADPHDMRICLENVLDLNPDNAQAQQGLAWVNAHYGAPPAPQDDGQADAQALATSLSAAQPMPDHPPATDAAYTGPTTRLVPEPASANVVASFAPPPITPPSSTPVAQGAPSSADVASAQPCPYCGAPTPLSQDRCRQCRNSLTVRAAPPDRRSGALTILGWLWVISGIPSLLVGLGLLILTLLLPRAPRTSTAPEFIVALFIFVFGLIYIGIGRGLLGRRRWAYYIVCFFTLLGLILIPFGIIQWAVMMRELPSAMAASGLPPRIAPTVTTVFWVIMFISFGFQLLYFVLVGLSFRDFFGPRVRLLSTVEPIGHREHYNSGVLYKDRGMWYMATKEWEAAVANSPRDVSYLHALGLAYAQLKQYDRARTTLDNALQIAPEHPQLRESRALVDRMAGAAR
jgi:tetratricopeptide (TPR) repeat protein